MVDEWLFTYKVKNELSLFIDSCNSLWMEHMIELGSPDSTVVRLGGKVIEESDAAMQY